MVNDFAIWSLTTTLPGPMSFNSTTEKNPYLYVGFVNRAQVTHPKT